MITFYCHYVCLLSAKEDWIIRLFFNETKKKNEMKCTRNEEREKKETNGNRYNVPDVLSEKPL